MYTEMRIRGGMKRGCTGVLISPNKACTLRGGMMRQSRGWGGLFVPERKESRHDRNDRHVQASDRERIVLTPILPSFLNKAWSPIPDTGVNKNIL